MVFHRSVLRFHSSLVCAVVALSLSDSMLVVLCRVGHWQDHLVGLTKTTANVLMFVILVSSVSLLLVSSCCQCCRLWSCLAKNDRCPPPVTDLGWAKHLATKKYQWGWGKKQEYQLSREPANKPPEAIHASRESNSSWREMVPLPSLSMRSHSTASSIMSFCRTSS